MSVFEGASGLCYHGKAVEINVVIDGEFQSLLEVGWLQDVAGVVLAAEGTDPSMELGLVITSQEKMRELNATHLGRDEPTDVLSFSMLPEAASGREEDVDVPAFVAPPDGAVHLGEVIVSYPQAVIQAEEHGHPVSKEVAILVVHGVLHLLGYDHDAPEPERRMRAREMEITERIEEKGL